MRVSFLGFDEKVTTFEADETVKSGTPVKMSANGKVTVCAAGDLFCGMAVSVRDGIAAVQLGGYHQLPYSGTGMAVGHQSLCADGNGGGKVSGEGNPGRTLLVVDVDSGKSVCGIIL